MEINFKEKIIWTLKIKVMILVLKYNDEKIETDLFNHQVIENVNNKLNNLYKGEYKNALNY